MTPCSIRTSATCQAPLGTVDLCWHGVSTCLEAVLGGIPVCYPLLPHIENVVKKLQSSAHAQAVEIPRFGYVSLSIASAPLDA